MTQTPVAIHVENLGKTYGLRRRTDAITHLNLTIPTGSIFALVGANGAGKTTLIKILMNIFPPSAGRAQVLGVDSTHVAGEIFTRIGYVSENQELPDWMTVGHLLEFLRPFYPQWDRTLEQQLIRQFDLPLQRKLKHLSRGQRMKAALASVLAYRPALIVLDEPFSGLDPLVRDELIESLIDRAPETTIFLSSHDLGEIESFASHVGFLEHGTILFSEEMSTLSSRFREVEITIVEPTTLPQNLPTTWLLPESSGHIVRFIESSFDPDRTPSQISELFPGVQNIDINPMPLRAIFLAVAKAGRKSRANESTTSEAAQEPAA
jgi:ABC-2 type transport system ATP-binding protein